MLYELTRQMLHTDAAFSAYGRSNLYIRTQHLLHTDAVETLRATSLPPKTQWRCRDVARNVSTWDRFTRKTALISIQPP